MKSSSDNERKMTLTEAARYLNVSPRKVSHLVKDGSYDSTRIRSTGGGGW